jgi:hypothetical protein
MVLMDSDVEKERTTPIQEETFSDSEDVSYESRFEREVKEKATYNREQEGFVPFVLLNWKGTSCTSSSGSVHIVTFCIGTEQLVHSHQDGSLRSDFRTE